MASKNSVSIIGNVGKDPQVRTLADGKTKVCNLSVATTQKGFTRRDGSKVEDRTDWHTVVLWRNLAEIAEKYFKKGVQISVDGSLRNRTWQDKDGNTRYVTEIMASQAFLTGNKGTDTALKEAPHTEEAPAQTAVENQQPFEGAEKDDNDGLPF